MDVFDEILAAVPEPIEKEVLTNGRYHVFSGANPGAAVGTAFLDGGDVESLSAHYTRHLGATIKPTTIRMARLIEAAHVGTREASGGVTVPSKPDETRLLALFLKSPNVFIAWGNAAQSVLNLQLPKSVAEADAPDAPTLVGLGNSEGAADLTRSSSPES